MRPEPARRGGVRSNAGRCHHRQCGSQVDRYAGAGRCARLRQVYAAGLDVTARTARSGAHALNRDNVVVTPHIASATDKGRVRMYSGDRECPPGPAASVPSTVSIPMSTKFWRDVPRECTKEDPGRRRRLRWMGQAHTDQSCESRPRSPSASSTRTGDDQRQHGVGVDQAVADFGFGHGSVDWNDLIANDDIDVVVICCAEHAARADRSLPPSGQACVLREAGGWQHLNRPFDRSRPGGRCDHRCRIQLPMGPLVQYAKQLIDAGELGEITNYRGRFFSMYGADPMGLLVALHARRGSHGVSSDILSHRSTSPTCDRRYREGRRYGPHPDSRAPTPNRAAPTTTSASPATRPARSRTRTTSARCAFENGARGVFESSRSIMVRRASALEVYGTKGSLMWNLETMNELKLFASEPELGYKTVYLATASRITATLCRVTPTRSGTRTSRSSRSSNICRRSPTVASTRSASPRRSTMSACRT